MFNTIYVTYQFGICALKFQKELADLRFCQIFCFCSFRIIASTFGNLETAYLFINTPLGLTKLARLNHYLRETKSSDSPHVGGAFSLSNKR